MNSRRLMCRQEQSIARGGGGRIMIEPPSRPKARSRLERSAMDEVAAPVASSKPAQLLGHEPASAKSQELSSQRGGVGSCNAPAHHFVQHRTSLGTIDLASSIQSRALQFRPRVVSRRHPANRDDARIGPHRRPPTNAARWARSILEEVILPILQGR